MIPTTSSNIALTTITASASIIPQIISTVLTITPSALPPTTTTNNAQTTITAFAEFGLPTGCAAAILAADPCLTTLAFNCTDDTYCNLGTPSITITQGPSTYIVNAYNYESSLTTTIQGNCTLFPTSVSIPSDLPVPSSVLNLQGTAAKCGFSKTATYPSNQISVYVGLYTDSDIGGSVSPTVITEGMELLDFGGRGCGASTTTSSGFPTAEILSTFTSPYPSEGSMGNIGGDGDGGHGGLSTGAKAGIGVGVPVGVILIMGIGWWGLMRRRKRGGAAAAAGGGMGIGKEKEGVREIQNFGAYRG